jgi:hypothetical protein
MPLFQVTSRIDILLNELKSFTGDGWEQEDDLTLVELQRLPGSFVTNEHYRHYLLCWKGASNLFNIPWSRALRSMSMRRPERCKRRFATFGTTHTASPAKMEILES